MSTLIMGRRRGRRRPRRSRARWRCWRRMRRRSSARLGEARSRGAAADRAAARGLPRGATARRRGRGWRWRAARSRSSPTRRRGCSRCGRRSSRSPTMIRSWRRSRRSCRATGPLAARVDAFTARYTIPPERIEPVMRAAIAECRARTLAPHRAADRPRRSGWSWSRASRGPAITGMRARRRA